MAELDHTTHEPPVEGDGHRAVALGALLVAWILAATALVLLVVNRPEWHAGQWYFMVDVADGVVYGLVGAVLLARTRHPVAWLVATCAVGGSLAALGFQWSEFVYEHPGAPELPLLQSTQSWAWIPGTLALILVVPYFVRERPLDPLSKLLVVVGSLIPLAMVAVRWTDPFPWPDGEPIMPFAIESEDWVARLDSIVTAFMIATVVGGFVATLDVLRRRAARPIERRRGLGWLALGSGLMSATFLPLALPASWTADLPVATTPVLHLASQLFFPAALLVAVLGQQLWGIRLAVSRAVAWSLLTAILVAAYVVIVSSFGFLLPGVTDGFEQVAATAAIAAAIGPVWRFVQRRVDHLVHGESREPIHAVGRVGRGVDVTGTPEDLLTGVLDELVGSLRLRGAAIDVAMSDGPVRRQAEIGDAGAPDELVTPLVLDDELIGSLSVWPRPGERLDATTRRALAALTPTIAIATRLTTTAIELADSRARLSSARDEERSALRRELHDGLGPAIAGVGYGLRAARNLLTTDPDAAATLLDTLAGEVDARVEDVRTLARELVPPTLVESGLPAALAELAERYRIGGFDIDLDVGEGIPALPQPTASALYGIAVEGVRNASRHSGSAGCTVRLAVDRGALALSIADAGAGIADDAVAGVGLQSMRERADAIGARLTIATPPGGGTTVMVRSEGAAA